MMTVVRAPAQGLLIAGHARSGTTLLKNVCGTHPELFVTSEFHVFNGLGRPFAVYRRRLRTSWFARPLVVGPGHWNLLHRLRSGLFYYRFLAAVRSAAKPKVELHHVTRALQDFAPRARLVGDKTPGYVFRLSHFAAFPGLKRLVIYRDPRDVAASALYKAQTDWQGKTFADKFLEPASSARSWLRAMEELESNLASCLAIRYEDLVMEPEAAVQRLADYLEVDRFGFDTGDVEPNRVGKHANRLSRLAVSEIEAIAGDMMGRHGYR
jgi:hypothetical protein